MPDVREISAADRLKAFVCQCCVLCIVAHRRPESAFAKKLRQIESNCPFCRAYNKIKALQRRQEH